jgi:hypothetical protein
MGFGLWREQIEALANPGHDAHAEATAWLGVDPEDPDNEWRTGDIVHRLTAPFSIAEANRGLGRFRREQ